MVNVFRLLCGLLVIVTLSGHPSAHDATRDAPHVSAPARGERLQSHPALDRAMAALLPIDVQQTLHRAAATPTLPPVLLPARAGLLRSAQLIVGPSWHALSMRESDYSVYIHASARAIALPGVKRPPVRVPSLNVPRISRTHDIVTAHFVAWGVAFDVDIECMGGVAHPLCDDDILVHELLRSLKRLEFER
ncbi:MAG: hypothetical protein ACPGU1_20090 [Myxococcota bacterium]